MTIMVNNIARMIRNMLLKKPSIDKCEIKDLSTYQHPVYGNCTVDKTSLILSGNDADGLVICVMSKSDVDRMEHIREYLINALPMFRDEGYLTFYRHASEFIELSRM